MSSKYLMIIDDVEDIRTTLCEIFELSGYRVSTAENGAEGLDKLRQSGLPCAVLLDLMMPVMDGWQVLEELRRDPGSELAKVPVIVMSGVADRSEIARLEQVYGCAVVGKPPDIGRLLEAVERLCTC